MGKGERGEAIENGNARERRQAPATRGARKERKMKRLFDKIKVALWKVGALKTVTTSEGWTYVRV